MRKQPATIEEAIQGAILEPEYDYRQDIGLLEEYVAVSRQGDVVLAHGPTIEIVVAQLRRLGVDREHGGIYPPWRPRS